MKNSKRIKMFLLAAAVLAGVLTVRAFNTEKCWNM